MNLVQKCFIRKGRLPPCAIFAIFAVLLTACSDTHDNSSTRNVAIEVPRALATANKAGCLTGTLTVGTKSVPLEFDGNGEMARATITGISPGTVVVSIDFFCSDLEVASAEQEITVVAGQDSSISFSDDQFAIKLVWGVTKWGEGQWQPVKVP